MVTVVVNVYGNTDDGCVRDHNEDSILIYGQNVIEDHGKYTGANLKIGNEGLLLMVADGMGGANAGEVASGIAKQLIKESCLTMNKIPSKPGDFLKKIIIKVHLSIKDKARKDPELKGMGTTIIIGWLIENIFHVAWVGDSRCYVFKSEQKEDFAPFTDDHSLVWNMVLAGEMSAEQARTDDQSNIILQSLGGEADNPQPDYKMHQVRQGDRILLCSDGLNGMLSDQGIQQILLFEKETKAACDKMIQAAKNAGGKDNISVLLLDILSDTQPIRTEKRGPAKKRRGFKFWFFTFVIFAFVFMGLYLLDQGALTYFISESPEISTDSTQQTTTITQNKKKKPTKKKVLAQKNTKEEVTPEDTASIEMLDSIRNNLSNMIYGKISKVEKELFAGNIKQVDEHRYNKYLFDINELKKKVLGDTLSYAAVNDSIYNEIDLKKALIFTLDSMYAEIEKLNKLKKLKNS